MHCPAEDAKEVSRRRYRSADFLASLSILASGSYAAGQGIAALGFLPGTDYSAALAVSGDGMIVVGSSGTTQGQYARAFRWSSTSGMVDLGVAMTGSSLVIAHAANSDGSVIAGRGITPLFHGLRWTPSTGMAVLPPFQGGFEAMAYAINADGSVIGGWTMDNGGLSACLWRNGVPASLGTLPGLPGFQQPTVYGLSSDGSIAAGTASTGGIDRAFRWSAPGGMQDLGTLAGWTSSAADAISGDGLVIVGGPQRAFRWTDQEGMHDLGVLAGTTLSRALAVNVDGTVIVGTSGERACMWSAATGLVDLNQYLPAIGINLKGWVLEAATGISSDGLTIVGHGRHNGAFEAWRAVLRPDCYANCDGSTVAPALNVADFICFINRFAGGDPRANCDGSTTTPMLNPSDFTCFAASFSAGCP